MNSFFHQLSDPIELTKKIPEQLKITLLSTYIIGTIAHFFCYTNVLFCHDAAAMYWEPASWSDSASSSRWLAPIWNAVFHNIQLPWLEGILTLFLYSLSAWLICELLNITRIIPTILTSGLLVTSPTAISSNHYLSSAHIYATALLFACLAVFAFFKWKHGWFACFICLLICEGSYAAYLNVALTLYLLVSIGDLSENKKKAKETLISHIKMLLTTVCSLSVTLITLKGILFLFGGKLQGRIASATPQQASDYISRLKTAVYDVLHFFAPNNGISYFQNQKLLYSLFIIGLGVSLLSFISLCYHNKLRSQPLNIILLLINFCCLPVAMNLIGIFFTSHTLMTFSYIMPWLFFLQTYEKTHLLKIHTTSKILQYIYGPLILLLCFITIYTGCILANASYMKAYANYESAIALSNRIINHIERIDGYVPGETRVCFVGDTREYYSPYRSGFAICDSLTGIGSEWWNTSLTYNFPLSSYIQQELGITMNIMNPSGPMNVADCAYGVHVMDENISEDAFADKLYSLDSFPKDNCYLWQWDIVLFKLSD